MDKLRKIDGKMSLLLITAILMLCAGFFIMSCGDPQQKAKNTDVASCAMDLSEATGPTPVAFPQGSDTNPVPSIAGSELTIEAWVKKRGTSTISGGIFSRYDAKGAGLFVSNDVPSFGIGRETSLPETGCTVKGTSTECIIRSGVSLGEDVWTHVAGVLVNEDHSSTHSVCGGAEAQTPHMDLFIDGEFNACSTTASKFADDPGDEQMTINAVSTAEATLDGVAAGNLNAVIDEIRFWRTARTQEEINNCMDTELGMGGACDRLDPSLIAYFRLNECEEADISDYSGNGFNGAFEINVGPNKFDPWAEGWVERTDAETPQRQD